MCGLTLCIQPVSAAQEPSSCKLVDSLHCTNGDRGPDAHGVYATRMPTPVGDVLVTLGASVLGLRGPITAQPLVGNCGVLGWNGQVFSSSSLGIKVGENDTKALFTRLESLPESESPLDVLKDIEGPYAFVYLRYSTKTIYFGVDSLSRRSLLLHISDANSAASRLIVSSSRSGEARKQGIEQTALDGSATGVLNLNLLKRYSSGSIDFSLALTLTNSNDRVAQVNDALPDSVLDTTRPAQECHSFISHLHDAVLRRVENIPLPQLSHARVAVLFSGGVDCSLLAALVHRCLPLAEPIELVNVAFQQQLPNGEASFDVPDRISGRQAAAELESACPGRRFRFVEVDVTTSESTEHRQKVVDLMYPSNTEMDISLAYPLYFASQGRGTLQAHNDTPAEAYQVTAKVFLSGLGADELMGGYSRHRRAFERHGWLALCQELQMDIDRLPRRNLSRDDRILSSHARDARYPFLDLHLLRHVCELPVWAKCNIALEQGVGDKMLIRLAAQACGLPITAGRVKRAMQFGTRSAKLSGPGRRRVAAGAAVISEGAGGRTMS